MIARIRSFTHGTSTPLASIFGSGFLVIISVLNAAVGIAAFGAMVLICLVAFLVGMVVRSNIAHVEPTLHDNTASKTTRILERIADITLVPAYVISVTLYVRILSAYALGLFGRDDETNQQILTTIVIAGILVVALIRGLTELERLESWTLWATFGIIALVLGGFAVYNLGITFSGDLILNQPDIASAGELLPVLAGTLIVVQGFEITRYLGEQYSAEVRIRASRNAQIIATVVYLGFVILATPLLHVLPSDEATENGLLDIAEHVAIWLPIPLVLAAMFSQFSAAVADAIGASGNIQEFTRGRVREAWRWWLILGTALALTWSASTLQILSIASRAFALYYCLQCLVALSVATSPWRRLAIGALATLLLLITIFAVPV